MPITIVARPIGPTYALSVANTQTVPIAVAMPVGETMNYAEFINTGSTTVCVVIGPAPKGVAAPTTPTLVFPVAGAPTVPTSFILGPSMQEPRVVPVPANGFAVSAIGSAAGPATVFITPVSVM
jgi:hypothetical protein